MRYADWVLDMFGVEPEPDPDWYDWEPDHWMWEQPPWKPRKAKAKAMVYGRSEFDPKNYPAGTDAELAEWKRWHDTRQPWYSPDSLVRRWRSESGCDIEERGLLP